MANLGEEHKVEETEYESEFEESLSALTTRRKIASDDGNSEGEARERFVQTDRRFRVGYGDESDGLGGYDEDDALSFEDEHEAFGNELLQLFKEEDDFEENECEDRSCENEAQEGVKQRKEKECDVPADPKIGAFYMHDDRFRGRHHCPSRWTLDERFTALKDEPKWKHDKFEEMKAWETYDKKSNASVEVRRISDQYHQGHPRNQGKGQSYRKANRYKTQDNINNQNYSSRVVRRRGPIKYKPIMRSSNANPPTKMEQSKKPQGQTSNTDSRRIFSTKNEQAFVSRKFVEKTSNSARVFRQLSNVDSDSLASKKPVFTAKTSSALQMFSPSNPVKYDSATQKREGQSGKLFGYFQTSALPNRNIYVPQCHSMLQGKCRANPNGYDKLYAESLACPASENFLTNLPLQSSTTWPIYTIASPQMMGQRDLSFSTMLTHQLSPIDNQISSVYPLVQQPIVQQMPVESMIQYQQLSQCSGSAAQASSEALLPNSYAPGTPGSLLRLNKSKIALHGKGISTLQGSGIGSLLSADTQSDQNFTATAALFPVFPEAAGTVGSAYHSPYIITDSSHTARSTRELSSYHVTNNGPMVIINEQSSLKEKCSRMHTDQQIE